MAQRGSRVDLNMLTARQLSSARRDRLLWYVLGAGIVRLAPNALIAPR